MKMFLRILICLALVAGVFTGLSFAGVSVSNYTVSKSTFQPGDTGITTITITNPTGNNRVTGLTMTIYNPSGITVTSSPLLADIESGGTAIVSIPFKIDSDAKPGIYLLNVEFEGITSQTSTSTQTTSSNTVSVPIIVVNSPILSIACDTKALSGVDSVTLMLANNGGSAKSLRISTAGTTSLYGVNEVYVGELKDSENVTVILDSRNESDGPVTIPFLLVYDDEIGTSHSDTANLRLTVKKEVLDLSFTQQESLTTKEDGTLLLEILNSGQALSDVRISFSDTGVKLKGASEIKVGNISSGENKSVSASVYPDLTPGLNLVNATVKWVEKDVQKEQAVQIPITVESDANVSVYLEAKPSPMTAGAEHTISVLISNIGSYPIDNVDVGLSSPQFKLLDVTPRQYIGSLAKDDFSTVQFNVKTTSEGSGPIYINVMYRDASGEWVNKTITQNAVVYAAATDESAGLVPIIIVIALAGIAVWFFKFRKKA